MKSSHSRRRVRPPSLQRQIETLIAYWRPILGLESWGIDYRYDETKDLANCSVKPGYEEAVIRFNPARMRRELLPTRAALEELVLHEHVHCLLPRGSEREVSRMTRSLLRARDRGLRI